MRKVFVFVVAVRYKRLNNGFYGYFLAFERVGRLRREYFYLSRCVYFLIDRIFR